MPDRTTRSELLQRARVTVGGVAVGGLVIAALPDLAGSKPSAAQDAEILNFALLLEHVQAGLYADALRRKGLTGELREFAEIVGAHERAHIAFIRKALGDKARKPPKLDFGEDTATAEAFTDVALKLEDLGVAAYNAQAPNLTKAALASRRTDRLRRSAARVLDPRDRRCDPGARRVRASGVGRACRGDARRDRGTSNEP